MDYSIYHFYNQDCCLSNQLTTIKIFSESISFSLIPKKKIIIIIKKIKKLKKTGGGGGGGELNAIALHSK